MNIDLGCPICGQVETRDHVVLGCAWTEPIWAATQGVSQTEPTTGTIEWLDKCRAIGNELGAAQRRHWDCMITTWHIWKARYKAEFEGAQSNLIGILSDIQRDVL